MNAVLREGVCSDVSALAEIDAAASPNPWSATQFDFQAERVLLIESDRRQVAFVVFAHVLDEGSIRNIAVHPDCQRQGLARQLLSAALQYLSASGALCCLLEVRCSNLKALALYKSSGFQVDATRKNYYPAATGREDAILMSKKPCDPNPSGAFV